MAVTTVDIEFRARLDQFRKEVEGMPGTTKKTQRELVSMWVESQKEAARAAAAAAKVKTGIEGVASEAGKLTKIGGLLGGQFGAAMQIIGDGSESLADGLGSAGRAALGVGAALAAAFATVSAVQAFNQYVVDGVKSFESLKETMGATHPVIMANEAAISEAATAMAAADAASAALHVTISGKLAPAVEESSYAWAGLYAAMNEVVEAMPGLSGEMDAVTKMAIKQIPYIGNLYAMYDILATGGRKVAEADKIRLAQGKRDLELANEADDATRQQLIALGMLEEADSKAAVSATARSATRVAAASAEEIAAKRLEEIELAGAFRKSRAAFDAATAEIQAGKDAAAMLQSLTAQKLSWQEEYHAKVDATVEAFRAKATAGAWEDLAIEEAIRQIRLTKDEEFRAIVAERDAADALRRQGLLQQNAAAEDAADAARVANYEKAKSDVFSIATNLNSAVMTLLDTEFDHRTRFMDKTTSEYRKQARKQFMVQKAWSLAQATINTAVGISQAVAQNAGMPVLMAISIAAAAAAGAVQIAAIASQKPSFHVGGLVRQPDEVNATLQTGEAVLNRGAVRSLGGEEGVDRLNRGAGMPGSMAPTVMVMAIDGRIVDQLWDGSPSGSGRFGLAARVDQRMKGGLSGQSGRWG